MEHQETENLQVVLSIFLLPVSIIAVPEPRDCKGFPQKTFFRYAMFRLREVLMYIDQYL